MKFFNKYKDDIMDASIEELKAKGIYNMDQLSLDGILLSINSNTIESDGKIEIEGSKYRVGDGAIGAKINLVFIDGTWKVEKAETIWQR